MRGKRCEVHHARERRGNVISFNRILSFKSIDEVAVGAGLAAAYCVRQLEHASGAREERAYDNISCGAIWGREVAWAILVDVLSALVRPSISSDCNQIEPLWTRIDAIALGAREERANGNVYLY